MVLWDEESERRVVRVGISLLMMASAASQRRCLAPVQVVSRFMEA